MKKYFPLIRFETYIDAPPAKVYLQLISSEGWDSWFTRGTFLSLDTRTIIFSWKELGPQKINAEETAQILSYKENELFSFSWHTESLNHPTLVTFVLTPKGRGTILSVTDEGYPRTQEGEELFMSCSAGWGEAMTLLKVYLETGYRYRNWSNDDVSRSAANVT